MTWTADKLERLRELMNTPRGECWPFVRLVLREIWNRETPEVPFSTPRDRLEAIAHFEGDREWFEPLDAPEDGCLVTMGHGSYARHVGVFVAVDGGLVVHAQDGCAALAQPVARLPWSRVLFFRIVPP